MATTELSAEAAESALLGRPGDQRGDGGDDAGDARVARLAHVDADFATARQVGAVERLQPGAHHEESRGHGRAGMAGEPHGVLEAVLDDAVSGRAEEAGKRVVHDDGGSLGEKIREAGLGHGHRGGRRWRRRASLQASVPLPTAASGENSRQGLGRNS